jgi:hypothetical protein
MIVIRVELWSAITGARTELARMHISNIGGTLKRRNYHGQTFIGRTTKSLDRLVVSKEATLENYPAEDLHIWNLVRRMLTQMGYTK